MYPLILASQSPRRRELLTAAGFRFEIRVPREDAEDRRRSGETPEDFVRRLAVQKADSVAETLDRGRIIGCDTIVVCRGEILEKPKNRDDARRMLRLLRGEDHRVLSGLCVLVKDGAEITYDVRLETTQLHMLSISDAELEDYLDTGVWRGKAGAFGYQDRNAWITITHGSESNVVGLPMELLGKMLADEI